MKIGLLGGTFDPPHNAHLHAAVVALAIIPLDEVWFLITGNPPHKNIAEHTPAEFRLQMLEAAITGYNRFRVNTIELLTPGPHYSVDTVKSLQKSNPNDEFHFILGSESFEQLSTWRDPDQLLSLVPFYVFERPGVPISDKYPHRVLPVQPLNISSTIVRERVKNRLPIDGLVPDAVRDLIKSCNFYRG